MRSLPLYPTLSTTTLEISRLPTKFDLRLKETPVPGDEPPRDRWHGAYKRLGADGDVRATWFFFVFIVL